jgi:hypothetical protein
MLSQQISASSSPSFTEMSLSAVDQAHGFNIPCRHLYVFKLSTTTDDGMDRLNEFDNVFNVAARKSLIHLIKHHIPVIAGDIKKENPTKVMNIDVSNDASVMRNVNYYAGTLSINSNWSPSEDDIIKGNFHDWPLKEMHS